MPKFQLSAELFDYTLDRLDQFEDLLFVEDYSESYRRFAQRVGWAHASIRNENHQAPILKNDTLLDDWDPLMSALDDALYEYARARYRGEQPPHPTTRSPPPTLPKVRLAIAAPFAVPFRVPLTDDDDHLDHD